jgi:NTE family protein
MKEKNNRNMVLLYWHVACLIMARPTLISTGAIMRASDLAQLSRQKSAYAQTALVLQGGGALGAYQAGAYQALSEGGCEPDWVCGVSIGAINAAIIAGNEPKDRLPRLKAFWERTTCAFPWPAPAWDTIARRFFNAVSTGASVLAGQPGFFQPRLPPAAWPQRRSPDAVSVYDTSPLRQTLEELVDFDRINAGRTRLSLGAVNVSTGNGIYFDSVERAITADHVMASGALPPGFPAICIEGDFYWDGGLISNTPLVHVLDGGPKRDTLVFQVDLFDARGELPGDAIEVEERRKHITFSSRTRFSTDHFQRVACAAASDCQTVRAIAVAGPTECRGAAAPRSRHTSRGFDRAHDLSAQGF